MPFTEVSYRSPVWVEGMTPSTGSGGTTFWRGTIPGYFNAEEEAWLTPGRVVVLKEPTSPGLILPDGDNTKRPVGVISRDNHLHGATYKYLLNTEGNSVGFPPGEMVDVKTRGDVVVWTNDPVEMFWHAYFRIDNSDPSLPVGRFTGLAPQADGSIPAAPAGYQLLPESTFITRVTEPGLVVLNLGNF